MKFELSIRRDFDRTAYPVCDRFLPSHPKELYELLPYWYFRTRFANYGTSYFDLPQCGLRRRPEHNERLWHKVSRYRGVELYEQFFMLGALLPFHDLFFTARSPLEVIGEKRDPLAPIGFRYL